MISTVRNQIAIASAALCITQAAQADVVETAETDEIAAEATLLNVATSLEAADAAVIGQSSFKDSSGSGVTSKSLDDGDIPGGKAYQVKVPEKMANPWDAVVSSSLEGGIAKGDNVDLTFWARAVDGPGKVKALVQRNSAPYEAIAEQEITLTSEWQEYTVSGNSNLNLDGGEAGAAILIGYDAQTLEFGQFEVKKAVSSTENQDTNGNLSTENSQSAMEFVYALDNYFDVDLEQSFSPFGNEDIANASFSPILKFRYDRLEAEFKTFIYYQDEKQAAFQPDFTYKFGWIDYNPGTFSFFYENGSGNRFNPGDGERVSRIENGRLTFGYAFRIDDPITDAYTGSDNYVQCETESRWTPRFFDLATLDGGAKNKIILSLDCKYNFLNGFFIRGEGLFYPIDDQQQPFDPDFTYGFGYNTYQRNTLAIEYENFTSNSFPGRNVADGGDFDDGAWKLIYHMPF